MRRLLVLVVLVACTKHEPHDAPPAPADPSTIYPLIVRASDLPTGPVRRPLVEGLVVTLAAAPAAGSGAAQAKLLRETDLRGLSLDAAYTTALANLEAAAKRGDIPVRAEMNNGAPLDIVWGHDWRAAACLLLPGAREQAIAKFQPPTGSGAVTVYAAIPNRDVLVFFSDPAVGQAALTAEPGGARPLTDHLLRLAPDVSAQPFWMQAPVVP